MCIIDCIMETETWQALSHRIEREQYYNTFSVGDVCARAHPLWTVFVTWKQRETNGAHVGRRVFSFGSCLFCFVGRGMPQLCKFVFVVFICAFMYLFVVVLVVILSLILVCLCLLCGLTVKRIKQVFVAPIRCMDNPLRPTFRLDKN